MTEIIIHSIYGLPAVSMLEIGLARLDDVRFLTLAPLEPLDVAPVERLDPMKEMIISVEEPRRRERPHRLDNLAPRGPRRGQ